LLFWSSILVAKTLKPNLKGMHISFAILVGYSLFFALPFNLLFKTNYVYLIEAPLKNVFPVFPYFIPILILILYILYWIQFLILKQFKAKL
jgi:hypothetical protein